MGQASLVFLCRQFLIAFLFAAALPLWGQEGGSASLVERIEASYNDLNYEETDRLLAIAEGAAGNFVPRERLLIWKYAAFRAVQRQQTEAAQDYFWKLLEIDPGFSLDPVTTSPKIIALFQKTKVAYLEALQERLSALESSVLAPSSSPANSSPPAPWRAYLFPGWEQLHRGYKTKGAAWAVLGAGALGGTVQALLRARDREQAYDAARDPQTAAARYQDYRRAYKAQFYWAYALAAVWLGSNIDAAFFSPRKSPPTLGLEWEVGYLGLYYSIDF